jgi:hypothetical protein
MSGKMAGGWVTGKPSDVLKNGDKFAPKIH